MNCQIKKHFSQEFEYFSIGVLYTVALSSL